MNRHDDSQHGNRDYYGRYDGYDRRDDHYHSTRNLTDEFERHYQHERGHWKDDRDHFPREHTYHEGDMGQEYERMRHEGRGQGYAENRRNDWNQHRNYDAGQRYSSHPRDYRSHLDSERRGYQESHRYDPDNTFYGEGSRRRDDQDSMHRRTGDDDRRSSPGNIAPNTHWSNPDRDRYEVNRYY
ncbi:hypothetical protein ACXYMU_10735 [Pontibacter sp. CAU 1760]